MLDNENELSSLRDQNYFSANSIRFIKSLNFKPNTSLKFLCRNQDCADSVQIYVEELEEKKVEVSGFLDRHWRHGCFFQCKAGKWNLSVGEEETLSSFFEKGEPNAASNESGFDPLSFKELKDILGLTIKKDDENKLITFLCMLSAYTEDSQANLSFNAISSTGKSYIPIEIARLFPEEHIVQIGYCSPAAFFHDTGTWDKEKKMYIVSLSRKILIFLDQPHNDLLARLRPLLSHDEKAIILKITDRKEKFGLRTKNVLLLGYPVVIFCTAGLQVDEQEATRLLLLSPEISQEKIRAGICEKIKKEVNRESYLKQLEGDPGRELLKKRIEAIKHEKITDIRIGHPEKIGEFFLYGGRSLKPRDQRDVGKVISLIKAIALLNLWFRERNGTVIVANEKDVEAGLEIWKTISEAQALNIPPYIYEIYQAVILPAWEEKYRELGCGVSPKEVGLERKEINRKHFDIYKRPLHDWQLRRQLLPMLDWITLSGTESLRQKTDINPPHTTAPYIQGK